MVPRLQTRNRLGKLQAQRTEDQSRNTVIRKHQHVKKYLATARKIQEDDDLTVNVTETQENPEEALAELEQSLQEEDDSG